MVRRLKRGAAAPDAMRARTFAELRAEGLVFLDNQEIGTCLLVTNEMGGLIERCFYADWQNNGMNLFRGWGRFVPIWVMCLTFQYRADHLSEDAMPRFRRCYARLTESAELRRALESIWRLDGQEDWGYPTLSFWSWWREHVDG